MMATIRSAVRLFKTAIDQIGETKQKICKTAKKIARKAKKYAGNFKDWLRSFIRIFSKKKRKKPELILIHPRPKQAKQVKPKSAIRSIKSKKSRHKKKQANKESKLQSNDKKEKKDSPVKLVKNKDEQENKKKTAEPEKTSPLPANAIKDFYREWEENWGPALNPLDKEFLESASPDIVAKVVANGRLTLKSPYLKAVYNGLKDLVDIPDLLENDALAKEKLLPFFKDYWDRKPDKFTDVLFAMHDKGVFPTRSGERKLSLDPRLVPEWLGLVG